MVNNKRVEIVMYFSIAIILTIIIYAFGFSIITSFFNVENFNRVQDNTHYLRQLVNQNTQMIAILNNKFNKTTHGLINISKDLFLMNRENVNMFNNEGKILVDNEVLNSFSDNNKLKETILGSLKNDPKEEDSEEVYFRHYKIINFIFNNKKNTRSDLSTNTPSIINRVADSIQVIDKEMKHFFSIPMDENSTEVKDLYNIIDKQKKNSDLINDIKKYAKLLISYDKKKNKMTLTDNAVNIWLLMYPEDSIYGNQIDYTIKMHLGTLVEIIQDSVENEDTV